MTKSWCVALAILLCLLVFAASASAECAWVLWQELTALSGGSGPPPEWSIATATAAEAECKAGLALVVKDREERSKRLSPRLLTVEGNRVIMESTNVALAYRYICLPDTVDPRGAKGK